MANIVDYVGDQDQPTQSLIQTRSGKLVDLQNMPGMVKINLIKEEELGIDQFITPANMPGAKLRVLRERHREIIEAQLTTLAEKTKKDYVVGDFVSFKGGSYEVLKVKEDGVMISYTLKSGGEPKNVWIPKKKVKKG